MNILENTKLIQQMLGLSAQPALLFCQRIT